jgi:phosphoenolpyruvate synthase/pyruvate phosphate dikinase
MDYRARQGIAPMDVSLAVVIQRMVEAEASGMMFTADPTTGRRGGNSCSGSVSTSPWRVRLSRLLAGVA